MENQVEGQHRFKEVITSEAELRAKAGKPSYWFQGKVLSKLNSQCRRFIGESPFVVVASTGADGRVDTSPKGDAPGFVQVLDDHTLAMPDRAGNRRFDTFCNLLQNPTLGMIFFIPGRRETLRVGGRAVIVCDPIVLQSMRLGSRVPKLATIISVERAYFHCGSCIARSGLWQAEAKSAAHENAKSTQIDSGEAVAG